MLAVAQGLEVGEDGAGGGGAVVQLACAVVAHPGADAEAVVVALAAHQAQLGGGADGLEGGGDGGPLVAIDDAETPMPSKNPL